MSEQNQMSARQLCDKIAKIADPYWNEGEMPFIDAVEALILADRKATVEKCKQAISDRIKYRDSYDTHANGLFHAISVLDEVIEKDLSKAQAGDDPDGMC